MSDIKDFLLKVACTAIIAAASFWVFNVSKRPQTKLGFEKDSSHGRQEIYEIEPGQWANSRMYALEQRAIFSQASTTLEPPGRFLGLTSPRQVWICVTHSGRFTKAGDYITLELAGFRVFLIRGKDNVIRTFHNVCRHRAFPVTRKTFGSATVIGCRYHGWSYDTKGQLTKAPQFDQLPGFDKSANSLFEVHTNVDKSGFIHINLDSATEIEQPSLVAPLTTGHTTGISPDSTFLGSWEVEGRFSWKLAMLDTAADIPRPNHGLNFTAQLFYYPLTVVFSDRESSIWFQLVYSPKSADQTTMRCDVFALRRDDTARFKKLIEGRLEAVLKEMIECYEHEHQTICSSGSDSGAFQREFTQIGDATKMHHDKEQSLGREIDPAAVQQCKSANFDKAQGICRALEELGGDKLAW